MTLKNDKGYGCIYCIENKINRKKYIGQTSKTYPSERLGMHRFNARNNVNSYLYNAMRKYGEDNFEFKILIHNIPIEKLNFYEILWIKKLQTKAPNGYNMTDGGEGTRGFVPWNKGIPRSKETIEKLKKSYMIKKEKGENKILFGKNNPMYGRHPSKETIEKLSILFKGEGNPFYGKHHTEETKSRLSELRNKDKKRVAMCDIETEEVIKTFDSYAEASRYLRNNTNYNKADDSAISRCARGKYNYVYGHKWKKLEGVTTNCSDETDTSRSA